MSAAARIGTDLELVENIIDVIASHAVATPDRPAIVDGDRIITYPELEALIAQHAGYIAELGVGQGDRFGLLLQDHADHLIVMLAAASLGAVAVPINWRAKVEEKRVITELFKLKLLIHDSDVRTPTGFPAVVRGDAWRRGVEKAAPVAPIASARARPFAISLTSGTTGVSKGVELTHAGAIGICGSIRLGLGLTSTQRHLSTLSMPFAASIYYNVSLLLLGNTVELFPTLFTPEEFVDAIKRRGITGSLIVPTIIRRLLPLASASAPLLPELKYLVSTGAPLSPDERRAAARLLTPGFFDGYGATGIGPITYLTPADIEQHAESVGRTGPLREVEIVDEADQRRPAGAVGVLRCRGPDMPQGFCNPGAASATELFRDGWYYPGDLAKLDEHGFLYIVGRVSDAILRGGSNIYPAEIEQVLMRHPAVREAAVVGVPSQEYGEEVIAFVHLSDAVQGRELLETCRRYLTPYKVPKDIVALADELPKNAGGKVLKSALAQMYQTQHPARGSH